MSDSTSLHRLAGLATLSPEGGLKMRLERLTAA
jgi:hypothetical protein